MNQLILFENPDVLFNVMPYYSGNYTLEIGDDIYYESDDMSDEDIIEWAEDWGYLEEEEGYVDEDGNPDVESLRDLKRSREEDCPPSYATPSGRAFLFFEEIEIPDTIGIEIIDGLHPGNDWQGVVVKGMDQLVQLQEYLLEKGTKVNFTLL